MTNFPSICTDSESKTTDLIIWWQNLASVNYILFTKWWETSSRIKIEAEIKSTVSVSPVSLIFFGF